MSKKIYRKRKLANFLANLRDYAEGCDIVEVNKKHSKYEDIDYLAKYKPKIEKLETVIKTNQLFIKYQVFKEAHNKHDVVLPKAILKHFPEELANKLFRIVEQGGDLHCSLDLLKDISESQNYETETNNSSKPEFVNDVHKEFEDPVMRRFQTLIEPDFEKDSENAKLGRTMSEKFFFNTKRKSKPKTECEISEQPEEIDPRIKQRFYLKVKEFSSKAKWIIIDSWLEDFMHLKEFDGLFTINFVPSEHFDCAKSSYFRPLPIDRYNYRDKKWLEKEIRDAFMEYNLNIAHLNSDLDFYGSQHYENNEQSKIDKQGNPSLLQSKSTPTLPISNTVKDLDKNIRLDPHSVDINAISAHLLSALGISKLPEDKAKNDSRVPKTIEEFCNSLINNHQNNTKSVHSSSSLDSLSSAMFPNPEFQKFISTLLLCDEVRLLNVKQPEDDSEDSKEYMNSIKLMNFIKKIVTTNAVYDEHDLMPLMKQFIFEMQTHFEKNEHLKSQYNEYLEAMRKRIEELYYKNDNSPSKNRPTTRPILSSRSSVESLDEFNVSRVKVELSPK